MHIDELVIEITRRCNARCKHCFRGNAQQVDISDETIDRILEEVDSIGCITFTGGEPTLAVDKVKYIFQQIQQREITLKGFFVLTNGSIIGAQELAHILLDMHVYIGDRDDSKEILAISRDQYHNEAMDPECVHHAHVIYQGLGFYCPHAYRDAIQIPVNEGRAIQTEVGVRDADLNPLVIGFENAGACVKSVRAAVYINVYGHVIPSCEMSYKSQEESSLGSIYDTSITDILMTALKA